MIHIRRLIAGALLLVLLLMLALPAPATVNTSANKTIAAGNGAATQFTFSFIGVAAQFISVTFTDASGNQTLLTQGSGSNQYQITLNAPVQGALWGVGGTVTYAPDGTPIAAGTTLTITRTLPLTQATTLRNQQSVQTLGSGAETAVDTAVMEGQQIAEQIGRALQMNPANMVAPLPLPPAAQLANMGLCGDSGGNNIVACTLPSSGVISSAMQPVVNAASVAAGRTALGLGTMAQENINGGTCGGATLQDDGSGNARVVFGVVSDATNQIVTCAFHGQQHMATGALVYTLPRATSIFNGFGFFVSALTQPLTFAPNAADGFSGMASGAALVIPPGTQAWISTNAQASGTWYISLASGVSLNAALNLQINCTTASSALSCSVLDRNGNTPSTASPVLLAFRDPTPANGDPVPRAITGPLSITVPAGATLGIVNGQANRIWIADFDNAGTHVLGVYNSLNSSAPSTVPWDETTPASGTAITSGSTNAQTWYTSSAVTTKSFRILGYVESTQPTAGTWSASPSKTQMFGPGVKKPGDIVQIITTINTTQDTTSSTSFTVLPHNEITVTPTSSANLIMVDAFTNISYPTNSGSLVSLSKGNVNNSGLFGATQSIVAAGGTYSVIVKGANLPNTGSPVIYALQALNTSGIAITLPALSGGSTFVSAMEIQI
jgi:hypothetical protein